MKNSLVNKALAVSIGISIQFFTASTCFGSGYFPDETFSKSAELPKKGKIKFREDWVYAINKGQAAVSGIKIGYEKFDHLGQKLEEANYDRDGHAVFEITYSYDEWGRENQCLGLKENNSFFTKWEYSFNENTKTLEKKVYNSSSNHEKTSYRFDSSGNICEEISYTKAGEINHHYKITYTAFNKPAELIEFDGNGAVYEKWIYFYNRENQIIEVRELDASLELYKKYLTAYDANGIQKEILTVDKDGNEIEKTVSVYQFF